MIVQCVSCGKKFEAGENRFSVFCVHCGHENRLPYTPEPGAETKDAKEAEAEAVSILAKNGDPEAAFEYLSRMSERYPESRFFAGSLRLWAYRFEKQGSRGKGGYADRFMRFFNTIIYFSRTRSPFREKAAMKEIDAFLSDPALLEILSCFESPRDRLYAEFFNAALRCYKACLSDRNYGSYIWGIKRLKDDALAMKVANDYYDSFLYYFAAIKAAKKYPELPRAVYDAYLEIFPRYARFMLRNIDEAPGPVRESLRAVLRITA